MYICEVGLCAELFYYKYILYWYIHTCSFHNKLKTTYLNGKVNRQVDFLLDTLLRIEKDNFFKYMRMKKLFEINQKAILEENRHQKGQKIPTERVEVHIHTYMYMRTVQYKQEF